MSLDNAMARDLCNAVFYTIFLIGTASLFALLFTATMIHFFRKRSLPPIRDVIIVAPHQDDCLILAGEYALAVIEASKTVRIGYTTCGDSAPATARAHQRHMESTDAWSKAGVAGSQLTFMGLPQSNVDGPSLWTEEDRRILRSSLIEQFLDAFEGSVVIIPAAYESHIDHRNSRCAALNALMDSHRSDLTVLECAEYNQLFHLLENPGKSLAYIGSHLFLLSRIVRRFSRTSRQGFADIEPLLQLENSKPRQTRKQILMQCFTSEYNTMLDRLARQPEVYRVVRDLNRAVFEGDAGRPPGFVCIKHRMLHWSTGAAWLAISSIFLTASYSFILFILEAFSLVNGGIAGLCFGLLAIECWRRRGVPERFVTAACALIGGLIGLFVSAADAH